MNGAPGGLSIDEFTSGAGQAPDVVIPFSRDVAQTSNLGAGNRPDCAILDQGLATALRRITGESEPPKRSLFSRLVG
jgi:hypothetical protein